MSAPRTLTADVRVVLVMPYEGIRRGLTLLLEGMRGLHVVAQTSSSTEGVELVHRHGPDLVILDADPRYATRAIVEIRQASPDSRLVVTVDESIRDDIEREFGADVDDGTIQPVYPGELFPTVRELLRQRKAAP